MDPRFGAAFLAIGRLADGFERELKAKPQISNVVRVKGGLPGYVRMAALPDTTRGARLQDVYAVLAGIEAVSGDKFYLDGVTMVEFTPPNP